MFNDIDKNDSLENWAKALSIPAQTVMYSIGLSFELSDLRNPVNKLLVKKRLRDIYALLNSVRPWFESDNAGPGLLVNNSQLFLHQLRQKL